jgi:hypothetical protein
MLELRRAPALGVATGRRAQTLYQPDRAAVERRSLCPACGATRRVRRAHRRRMRVVIESTRRWRPRTAPLPRATDRATCRRPRSAADRTRACTGCRTVRRLGDAVAPFERTPVVADGLAGGDQEATRPCTRDGNIRLALERCRRRFIEAAHAFLNSRAGDEHGALESQTKHLQVWCVEATSQLGRMPGSSRLRAVSPWLNAMYPSWKVSHP